MKATLTKVYMDTNNNSMVSLGHDCAGTASRIIMHPDANQIEELSSLQDIQIGDMIYVDNGITFLKTSAIKEIILMNKVEVVFETQTSIYRLTRVK